MAVKFGTPPPKARNRGVYKDDADTLRAHPNEWAHLNLDHCKPSTRSKYSTAINRGQLHDFPKGEFEAIVRRGEVWVRYVGGAQLRVAEPERREVA